MATLNHREIAILDFGSQYSHIIARRIREQHCFCELYSCLVKPEVLATKNLAGIVLSGGPNSVYEEGAPHVDPGVWALAREKNLPILGICYGVQELVTARGGKVEGSSMREFGRAELTVADASSPLFKDVATTSNVWMSHSDKVIELPEGFATIASTASCEFAAVADVENHVYGLQFHPEVTHSAEGRTIIRNFVLDVCKCPADWNMSSFVDEVVANIREQVGEEGQVLGAVSGGVDSTVAAVLMHKAIGNRFHALLVDNGLLRKDEAVKVLKRMRDECGVDLHCVDASEMFLTRLAGVADPEAKRKIIGNTFIELFEEHSTKFGKMDFLLQGTLYPDVIESISYKGPSHTIKSHHNVGGLLDVMRLKLIEPLRELFKDEVRELGMALGLPRDSVFRHPFPGPGLAIRILGDITPKAVAMLQEADDIYISELIEAGHYDRIAQAGSILLNCKSVGVMGDGRTYEQVLALRAVETTDYMTADWYHMPYDLLARISNRIINEVAGINRVVYDISSKPPATIEWE